MLKKVSRLADTEYRTNLLRELFNIEHNTSHYVLNHRCRCLNDFLIAFLDNPEQDEIETAITLLNIFLDETFEFLQTYDKFLTILDCRTNNDVQELYEPFAQYTILKSNNELTLQFMLTQQIEDKNKLFLVANVIYNGKNSMTKLVVADSFVEQIKDIIYSIEESPLIII